MNKSPQMLASHRKWQQGEKRSNIRGYSGQFQHSVPPELEDTHAAGELFFISSGRMILNCICCRGLGSARAPCSLHLLRPAPKRITREIHCVYTGDGEGTLLQTPL